MDIILFLLIITLSIIILLTSIYLFEDKQLEYIYIIYNIISFIMSFKIIEILKININANIVISSLLTLMTYIIIEKKSIKEYKNIVKKTFIINVIISLIILINCLYFGTVSDLNYFNMLAVYLVNYKILIIYPIVTLINQLIIYLLYDILKSSYKDIRQRILITNLTTYMIETFIFIVFSYVFTLSFKEIFFLIINNYLFKVLISLIYIPLIVTIIKAKKVNI